MEFDWLDCPNLMQTDDVNQPSIGTEDLSVISFDVGHKPSGKAAADDDYQQLTFTPSSSWLPYRFPNYQPQSPQELATMTSSTTGDGPRNKLPHPTLGSTMATTSKC